MIRPMNADERAFVVSGWSSSYRLSPHAGLLPMHAYAAIMHPVIESILDHPTTRVLVAEAPGDVDHEGRPFLYGFIAYREPRYVYYAFVKSEFRRGRSRFGLESGYGRQLMTAAGIDPERAFEYACHTKFITDLRGRMVGGVQITSNKLPHATFNPLPARFLHDEEERRVRHRAAARR